jgi:DNA-binding MarR family transcriptional regulator
MDLNEEVLIALRQIIRATDLHSRYLVKKYGLTGPQLLILVRLSQSERKSVGEIAGEVSLSQATVTDILDRLEARGYISRERSYEDKRRMTVALTGKGADIMRNKPSLLQEQFLIRFSALDDWEQSSILSSLQRVAAMMKADVISAPPVLDAGPIPKTDEEGDKFIRTTKETEAEAGELEKK